MALISANWRTFKAPISAAAGWAEMRKWLTEADRDIGGLDKCVYVIRTRRPFSIAYPHAPTPVLYIGEGKVKARLRDHMKEWIFPLAPSLPTLELEFRYAQIRVRGLGSHTAYRDVEADLLDYFYECFGASPVVNSQFENHTRVHRYSDGFFSVLHPGKGPGFKWALAPMKSNTVYRQSLKGHR